MLRPRVLICLLALILALPSAAFAQGAGDDQYQDPFGDEPAQPDSGGEGLSDTPPGTGSDPRVLGLLGSAFVLMGVGLRLRTIDPDAF